MVLSDVDLKRIEFATRLNERERAAFSIGLGYFQAFGISKEIMMGHTPGVSDMKMLDDVNWALGVLGEPLLPTSRK